MTQAFAGVLTWQGEGHLATTYLSVHVFATGDFKHVITLASLLYSLLTAPERSIFVAFLLGVVFAYRKRIRNCCLALVK